MRFSGSTVISRLLGLVREQVFSHYFGASAAVDAFYAAFRIPNLLREFFAEGALSAAYVPVFSQKLKDDGKQKAFLLTSTVLSVLLVILGLITILGIIFAPYIVKVIAAGFAKTPGQLELTTTLTQIMFPFLIFVACAAAVMGTLNCFGRFGLPALAPVGFNIALIVAGLFCRQYFDPPIIAMAWGALAGGVLQLVIQIPQLYAVGFRFKFVFSFADRSVRQIIRLMGPAALGVAAAQVNIVVGTLLASFLATGSIAYLNYAFRLMHFPLGVFGVAVATVSLAELAKLAAGGEADTLLARYIKSCRMQITFLLPSALFLIVAARPICALIYQHGLFGWEDSINAAFALQAYCAGLVFFGLVRLSAQVFYAYKNTATPVRIAVVSMVINVILMLLLMKPLGFIGLALAPGIAALANFLMLTYNIRKKVGRPRYSYFIIHMMKTLVASSAGASVIYLILNYFDLYSGYAGVMTTAYHLAVGFIAGVAVFGVIGYGLGIFRKGN
ncbi:MAG: murein biosynthesis integral membrane protein MurJ [candidate division Zixibacteria bacterium]|nr:murein biosynthesis integral membrane protein MurJ [candidate division Zixibacteria bacterium]